MVPSRRSERHVGSLASLALALASGCAMGIGAGGDDVARAPQDAGPLDGPVVHAPDVPVVQPDGETPFDTGILPIDAADVAPMGVDRVAAMDSCSSRPEVCNGVDDNCNGTADEGFACVQGSPARTCATRCGTQGSQTCSAACALGACAPPAESCDLVDDDCNGRCDDVGGCRVAIARGVNPTTGEHFYSTSASEAACCGFRLESASAFYLYAAMAPGTVPFYRCDNPALGRHFYTVDPGCEGDGHSEGVLGYIATTAACGASPLYRVYNASAHDHLFTPSAAERDAAIASGYVLETSPGFVWLADSG